MTEMVSGAFYLVRLTNRYKTLAMWDADGAEGLWFFVGEEQGISARRVTVLDGPVMQMPGPVAEIPNGELSKPVITEKRQLNDAQIEAVARATMDYVNGNGSYDAAKNWEKEVWRTRVRFVVNLISQNLTA